MEMATDSGAEDDTRSRNLDVDRASVKSLEETQQSWLLEPKTKKKKKEIDLGCMVCSRKLFLIIFGTIFAASAIVGLSILIWKVAPRKHHRPPPLDNYTVALKLALKFFDAQKCERTLACPSTHQRPSGVIVLNFLVFTSGYHRGCSPVLKFVQLAFLLRKKVLFLRIPNPQKQPRVAIYGLV